MCLLGQGGCGRGGLPPHFSVCAAAFSETWSANSGLERWTFGNRLLGFHRLSDSASLQGLWGVDLKDVLPALFLKERTVEEWISDSLPVVLASGKGSKAVV